jgi:hypothetical protein
MKGQRQVMKKDRRCVCVHVMHHRTKLYSIVELWSPQHVELTTSNDGACRKSILARGRTDHTTTTSRDVQVPRTRSRYESYKVMRSASTRHLSVPGSEFRYRGLVFKHIGLVEVLDRLAQRWFTLVLWRCMEVVTLLSARRRTHALLSCFEMIFSLLRSDTVC